MILILSLTGCTSDTVTHSLFIADEDAGRNAETVVYSSVTEIASNGRLTMEYDPVILRLNLKDAASGRTLWSTGVTEEEYGQEIMNRLTEKALKQLINVKYTDFGMKSGAVHNLSDECETTLRRIENGIRFDFDFTDIKIKVSLEFTLTENGVTVRMPRSAIDESGSNKITSIDVLPMLGASLGSIDGYFFVPDGSGALYEFGSSQSSDNVLSLDVYDYMLMDLDTAQDDTAKGIEKVSAPVFGVKHPDKGLFANITAGEENCSITMQTDTGVYAINRIYPVVRFRKQYFMTTAGGNEVQAYEKETYVSDLEIEYTVLDSGDCGYSEMAAVYREYLEKEGVLTKKDGNTEAYPFAVDFLVSMQKDTMLFKQTVTTASFSDIAGVLAELSENGVEVSKSILYGWQKEGYYQYPASGKVSGAAGGAGDLKKLVSETADTQFYLLSNYFNASSGNGGFSTYTDVIYKIDSVPLTNEDEDKYLLNLYTQRDRIAGDIKSFSKYMTGLAAEGMGSILYEDYESRRRITRSSFKQITSELLGQAAQSGVPVAVDGFAPYLLGQADYVFNLPSSSSSYMLLGDTVPFLQMVLHGYTDYSDSVPGNLSDDIERTKLLWVEYGYMPTFLLTCENSDLLKDTEFNVLFSSEYEIWRDELISMSSELGSALSEVCDSVMVRHHKENSVAVTEYENGKKVIVNYNGTAVTVDGVTVPAMSYTVV